MFRKCNFRQTRAIVVLKYIYIFNRAMEISNIEGEEIDAITINVNRFEIVIEKSR